MTQRDYIREMRIKAYKKDSAYSYSCGVFPTFELIENRAPDVLKVLFSSKGAETEGIKELCVRASKLNIPVIEDSKTLERIYPKENCYAAGIFNKYTSALRQNTNHAALVNPSDMGNLGTILRTLIAFGIEDLAIITPAADIFDPKVIRASMGAIFHMHFCAFNSFKEYTSSLKDTAARQFYPFMLNGQPLETIDMPQNAVFTLVFGNEARGLDDSFLSVGTPVRINHLNTVDSLNLPTAVAIGAYIFTKGTF